MRVAPDGEVAYALYGKMRRAMDVFPWGVVLKDVVRRDRDTGEARQVRVTVDETKEFGFCLRHACVDFDWAPDPSAPAHVAPVSFESPRGVASRSTDPSGRGLCRQWRPWGLSPPALATSRSLAVGVAAPGHRGHLADACLFLRGGCLVRVGARARRASSHAPWGCCVSGGARLGIPSDWLAPCCGAGGRPRG